MKDYICAPGPQKEDTGVYPSSTGVWGRWGHLHLVSPRSLSTVNSSCHPSPTPCLHIYSHTRCHHRCTSTPSVFEFLPHGHCKQRDTLQTNVQGTQEKEIVDKLENLQTIRGKTRRAISVNTYTVVISYTFLPVGKCIKALCVHFCFVNASGMLEWGLISWWYYNHCIMLSYSEISHVQRLTLTFSFLRLLCKNIKARKDLCGLKAFLHDPTD